jgi:hypothetical protein
MVGGRERFKPSRTSGLRQSGLLQHLVEAAAEGAVVSSLLECECVTAGDSSGWMSSARGPA